MMEINEKLENLDIDISYKYYWSYQYYLGKHYIIPFFRSLKIEIDVNVCEIGSAEGGVAFAFAEEGALSCLATDIATNRLEAGERIATLLNRKIDFRYHDILNDIISPEWFENFGIVILRDVIEHLDDTTLALAQISKMLRKGGYLYVTFPPYFSPFGGHQHLLNNFFGKFPFIHWLPISFFELLIKNGRPADVAEVRRLKKNKFTINKFFSAVLKSDFTIFDQRYFLLRPVYQFKFGLKPIQLPKPFTNGFLKEILPTEASFILQKK
ncbi:MAG: class I SAM-dependent methyltransferase [Ignavibacteria bacterium]|nr:class I SAM-dependent methyltransferase [Ignavibacteria bacterium]